MIKLVCLVFSLFLLSSNGYTQDSWKSVLKNKKGTVELNYSNSDVFISDKTGVLKGIEFDVMTEFVKYVSLKYNVSLKLKVKKQSGFNEIFDYIKSSDNGSFGASSFSITQERLKEVNFTPKYMNNVETMVSSSNLPIFKDTVEFLKYIDEVLFLVIPNTTYEDNLNALKVIAPQLNVLKVDDGTEALKDYYLKENYIGFSELASYFMAKKNGVKIKRQHLFKYTRLGYGIIYPITSDWKNVVDEFFNNHKSKALINGVIKKHLGDDINELILNLSGHASDELLLLTKENEWQDMAIGLNEVTLLKNKLEKEKMVAENLRKEKRSYVEKIVLFSGVCVLLLILGFSIVIIRNKVKGNKIIQQQKERAELQKGIIEEQHKELSLTYKSISASIKYAERLQLAILPSRKDLDEGLGDGFVMFKPKDVVSGDFYWFHEVNGVKILAVADCTGHGVPGAMVSVVCNEALNRCVKEFNLVEPNQILNKSRELIVNTFAKSGKGIQDGMDICMISLENNKLRYSGAYNPLWIVRDLDRLTEVEKNRKSTIEFNDSGLIELKACKQPVGLYENAKPFKQTEMQLFENDKLYLFTDGFSDQFGGEQNKKFKSKLFKELLISNSGFTMLKQQKVLSEAFDNWKGNGKQIDDVCVIGLAPSFN